MLVLIRYVVAYLRKENINFVWKDSTRPYKRRKKTKSKKKKKKNPYVT